MEITITTELNYGIFVNFILKKLFNIIEKMNHEQIISKVETIPKIIKFAWEYQFNENLCLLIDPKGYKIFVNQNNELKKYEDIYLKEGFENFKYSEIEEKLFELSNSKIINMNYKELFLASSFDMVLGEYKNNFKSIKLIDICKNRIDYSITNYFYHNKHCNLLDKKYEEFRIFFFGLNKLLKENPSLKGYFPQFMKERKNISLKLLECQDDEMD